MNYIAPERVSVEYVYWQQDESEVRAFLRSTNAGMDAWFTDAWDAADAAANEIFDPDVHDTDLVADMFAQRVGIWPSEYFWQLSSAAIKDSCTLLETFLERTANAVLRRRTGRALKQMQTEDSWRWEECELFYRHYMRIEVRPRNLEAALWIRNKVTHLRDELRTSQGLTELQGHLQSMGITGPPTNEEAALGLIEHPRYMTRGVSLSQLETWRYMDVISDHVGEIATAAFSFLHGTSTSSHLEALKSRKPIPVPGLKPARLFVP